MSSTAYYDRTNQQFAENLGEIINLSSRNEEMRNCIEIAHFASKSSTPVMLTGESGVGKSLMAMSIHYTSPKRSRPCVTLNCATLRDHEIKARLFGDSQGVTPSVGLIAKAGGGTLIIDAVDLLPSFVQRQLLAAIMPTESGVAESAVQRLLSARIISTSGNELIKKTATGLFVEELMYCLGEITIRIPPLRERREDMEDLTRDAITVANRRYGREVKGLSNTARDFIRHYEFPGNITELFLIINRAVRAITRDTIYVEDLGLMVDNRNNDPHFNPDMTLLSLSEMEKRHINKALLRTGWKKRAAARILRISQTMLNRKIKLYGLEQGSRVD